MKRLIFIALAALVLAASFACGSNSEGESEKKANSPGATLGAVTSPSPTPDGDYTVRIGFPTGSRDARAPDGPDLWALEQGFFDQEFKADGIRLEFTPFLAAGPAVNEALAAGSLDIAVYADTAGLIGKASGVKTSLVAVANPASPAWLVVSGSSPIQKAADLKGKKVATIKATFPHRYLLEALRASGLQASDIEFVNMTIPDSEQALAAGQVDAIVSLGWYAQRLLQQGYRAIHSTDETPAARAVSVIVANDGFIAAHPTFFPRYYHVRQRATEWANANRDQAIALLAKAAGGIDPALIEPLYLGPRFNFDLELSAEVLERVKATELFLREQALTRSQVDVEAWISGAVAYGRR